MKILILICFVTLSTFCKAQVCGFDFNYLNNNRIYYDSTAFNVDTVTTKIPSKEYLDIVTELYDDKVYLRCLDNERYVFPLRVKYKGEVHIVTFTSSGLYACNFHDKVSMYKFQEDLLNVLETNDTIELLTLPAPIVGSANYYIGKSYDVEFSLFRKNKWAFLNYFFKKEETGCDYRYIGHFTQIPLVVSQLYSWNILVSDGHGSDQLSEIYIKANNFPDLTKDSISADIDFIECWMKVFGNVHLYKGTLIDRTPCETRDDRWWRE